MIQAAGRLLRVDPQTCRNNARMLLSEMEDPYNTLESEIKSITDEAPSSI